MEKEVKPPSGVEEKSHDPSTPARGVATKSAGEARKPQQWLQHGGGNVKVWEIRFRCLDTLESDIIHLDRIPYGYAKTKEEALEIFFNTISRFAKEYDVQVISIVLKEVR